MVRINDMFNDLVEQHRKAKRRARILFWLSTAFLVAFTAFFVSLMFA